MQHVDEKGRSEVHCSTVYPQPSSSSPGWITVLLYQCDWQPQEPYEHPTLSKGCTFHNLVFVQLCPATRVRRNRTQRKLCGPILPILHLFTALHKLMERVTAVMCLCVCMCVCTYAYVKADFVCIINKDVCFSTLCDWGLVCITRKCTCLCL